MSDTNPSIQESVSFMKTRMLRRKEEIESTAAPILPANKIVTPTGLNIILGQRDTNENMKGAYISLLVCFGIILALLLLIFWHRRLATRQNLRRSLISSIDFNDFFSGRQTHALRWTLMIRKTRNRTTEMRGVRDTFNPRHPLNSGKKIQSRRSKNQQLKESSMLSSIPFINHQPRYKLEEFAEEREAPKKQVKRRGRQILQDTDQTCSLGNEGQLISSLEDSYRSILSSDPSYDYRQWRSEDKSNDMLDDASSECLKPSKRAIRRRQQEDHRSNSDKILHMSL